MRPARFPELPAACRPRLYELDGFLFARTRRDLLNYLWYVEGLSGFNITKEGPTYACTIGTTIHATHLRRIDSVSVGTWAKRIKDHYFPF